MSPSRPASLAGRAALALGALLLALGAVELGVRSWRPQPLVSAEVPPLLRGQFREPGDHPNRSPEFSVRVHVNRHRFVDREWGEPQPGVPRVVVIGDSFVEAAQVELEQGFGRVLEARLNDHRGAPVEVLSLGVPGAGTATALGLLEEHALPQEPDLVVLGFLVSNDVLNNHPLLEPKSDKPFYRLVGERLEATDASQHRGAAWRVPGLWGHSHAWRFVARSFVARQLARERLVQGDGVPIDLRVHDPAGGPSWEEAWVITDALLERMANSCAEHDVAFATLVFPSAVEATRQGRQAAEAAWPALEDWDLSIAGERAASLAGRHGPALDLTPALSTAQGQGALYYPQDGHWTPLGHRVAAEAAAPFVADLLEGDQGSGD